MGVIAGLPREIGAAGGYGRARGASGNFRSAAGYYLARPGGDGRRLAGSTSFAQRPEGRGLRCRQAPVSMLLPPPPHGSSGRKNDEKVSVEGLRGRRELGKMQGCRESDAGCLKIEKEIARMCEASSLTHGLTGAVTRALT